MLDLDVREMDDICILNGGGKFWVATFAVFNHHIFFFAEF